MATLVHATRVGTVRVADVMVTIPKTHDERLDVAGARRAFGDDHVHMLLLTSGRRLVSAVVRADLGTWSDERAPATAVGTLVGRTVRPSLPADQALADMRRHGLRRLAVVDDDGVLVGLLCLKRTLTGWCSDDGVRSRASAAQAGTSAADDAPSRPAVDRR